MASESNAHDRTVRRSFTTRTIRRTLVAISILAAAGPTVGELQPTECAILFNSNSDASKEIAQYYATRRGIPMQNIFAIDVPITEKLSRDDYERLVLPAVRSFLADRDTPNPIRCLVTCYDVPLRVGPYRPTDADRAQSDALAKPWLDNISALNANIDAIRNNGKSSIKTAPASDSQADQLKTMRDAYRSAIASRVKREPPKSDKRWESERRALTTLVQQAEGASGILRRQPAGTADSDPRATDQFRSARAEITNIERRIKLLTARGSPPVSFSAALPLIQKTRGLFGVAETILRRGQSLRGKDSRASLDSELSVAQWDSPEIAGWLLNPLHFSRRSRSTELTPTLMVSRLDAPTPALVRKMIDDAIKAERAGLSGVFYIDARGKVKRGLRAFDDNLLELADLVRKQSSMPVVLDRRPDVFAPGDCPNAALYCGWYSLSKYVDAFDFVPGAVAVHIASFELVSLRKPNKHYWCKSLIEDGVAATYGATSEPYLESFPLPTEFFGRLLTGQFTLAEAYYQTLPTLSWQLTLLGDPLYNPFRASPQLPKNWNELPNGPNE